jgi:hypothetical protein
MANKAIGKWARHGRLADHLNVMDCELHHALRGAGLIALHHLSYDFIGQKDRHEWRPLDRDCGRLWRMIRREVYWNVERVIQRIAKWDEVQKYVSDLGGQAGTPSCSPDGVCRGHG